MLTRRDVVAGDNQLLETLRSPELQLVASRIRQRLVMAHAEPERPSRLLDRLLEQAGNPGLMTTGLKDSDTIFWPNRQDVRAVYARTGCSSLKNKHIVGGRDNALRCTQ